MAKHYTEEQDDIIRKYYPTIGVKVLDMLPDHDEKSVIYRAKKLGCHSNANHTRGEMWTKEEEEVLKYNYTKMGSAIVCLLPNRSLQAIANKAQHMGIRPPGYKSTKSKSEWTRAEDRIIIKHCYDYISNKLTFDDSVLEHLPNRSEDDIRLRVASLAKYRNSILGGYPINIYISITGSHKNYISIAPCFINLVEAAFVAIKTNSNKPKIAEKIVNALELHYKFGMDVVDIAEELGINEDGAKWLLNTGNKFMSNALVKKGASNESY